MEYLTPEDIDYRIKFDQGIIKLTDESISKIGFLNRIEIIGEKFTNKFPFNLSKDSTIIRAPHLFTLENISKKICSLVSENADYFFCLSNIRVQEDSMLPELEIITYNYHDGGEIYCNNPYQMVPQIEFEDNVYFTDEHVNLMLANGINPLFFYNFNNRFVEVVETNDILQIHLSLQYFDVAFEEQHRPFLTGKYPDDEITAIPS